MNWVREHVSIWAVLGGILIGVSCLSAVVAAVWISRPKPAAQAAPTAVMTVIPAPTLTPTEPGTPEPTATLTPNPAEAGGIAVGMYVQISGTNGEGLRLRSGPGTDQAPRGLGYDSEVFQVKDGPRQSGDYYWWYLVSPTDPNRAGWAASNFLTVLAEKPE
jgi:hypothetical protein